MTHSSVKCLDFVNMYFDFKYSAGYKDEKKHKILPLNKFFNRYKVAGTK